MILERGPKRQAKLGVDGLAFWRGRREEWKDWRIGGLDLLYN